MPCDIPRFSVVIPLCNKAESISKAIESVLAQDVISFELIIVDDGSTDGSAAKVRQYTDNRIRLIHQDNSGVSEARNCGIRLARGSYIALLDADDLWLPGHLASLDGLIRRYPSAGAYATAYYIREQGRDKELAGFKFVPKTSTGGIIENYYRSIASGPNPVWSSAVCIPRQIFAKVGYFPKGVRLYEDLYMWTKIALKYPIAYIDKPSAVYCRDAENRACIRIVPDRDDLEFSELLLSAIHSGGIASNEAKYAYEFIDRYALLNAFKSVIGGNSVEARYMLKSIKPRKFSSYCRKWFIKCLTRLPASVVIRIWWLGSSAKRMVT